MSDAAVNEAPARPPGALRAAWQGWPGRVGRLVIATLPLVWLFKRVVVGSVGAHARQVGAGALFLSWLALIVSTFIGSVRWGVMMRAYGAERLPSIGRMMLHNMVGHWFNVLPSGVAGDAVRAHRVRAALPTPATSFVVIFVERIAGLIGLCAVAVAALALSPDLRDDAVTRTMWLAVLGGVALGSVVCALPYVLARNEPLRSTVRRVPLIGPVVTWIPAAQDARRVLLAVAMSVLTQVAAITAMAIPVMGLAPSLSLVTAFRIIPVIILFTYIPLTPGGLGQREVAFVTLFGTVGIPREISLASSLLVFAAYMSLAATGGLCLLAERVLGLGEEDPS
ncbi:MAG: lysylphosphatidylglycerol synthase transmembrane domain-containing protein [Polyangiales bacterium]